MSDKPYLPPGVLPNIFDTDPPPLNPATIIGDGFVAIDESVLEEEAMEESLAEEELPPPPESTP